MTSSHWKKYAYAFVITAVIFATALWLGNYFGDKKIENIKAAENQISIDILSSETEFALLGELSCPDAKNSTLSGALNSLGEKLDYGQERFGAGNEDFAALKKQYSLLEMKDYLLMKKLRDCPDPPATILYFYASNCADCDKEGDVLTFLRGQYPELRVYSFDYNLDLSALHTLSSIYGIERQDLPALVINHKLYAGFRGVDSLKSLFSARAAATSTPQILNDANSKK